ncbi:ATP-binding protein [Streptomyces sp. NPDC047315]|uniref:ATP-binding protein n=1 Tax=Streptomyces sp. NPDC047315 TaxID=3155142 RepID=UPI0033E7ED99
MSKEITQPPTATRQFSVQLSATRRGARLARLLAIQQLQSWGCEHANVSHVVAELAANAVMHGRVQGRDFRLRLLALPGVIRIELIDARGDRAPMRRRQDEREPAAEGGRGLLIVSGLADRWGVSSGPPPCKTVWAELDLPTHSPRRGTPAH